MQDEEEEEEEEPREKSVRPCAQCSFFSPFFHWITSFALNICTTNANVRIAYANQHERKMFRFSYNFDGKQTPTPPPHFGFIYDAMKMDFRFAEPTVNS